MLKNSVQYFGNNLSKFRSGQNTDRILELGLHGMVQNKYLQKSTTVTPGDLILQHGAKVLKSWITE